MYFNFSIQYTGFTKIGAASASLLGYIHDIVGILYIVLVEIFCILKYMVLSRVTQSFEGVD